MHNPAFTTASLRPLQDEFCFASKRSRHLICLEELKSPMGIEHACDAMTSEAGRIGRCVLVHLTHQHASVSRPRFVPREGSLKERGCLSLAGNPGGFRPIDSISSTTHNLIFEGLLHADSEDSPPSYRRAPSPTNREHQRSSTTPRRSRSRMRQTARQQPSGKGTDASGSVWQDAKRGHQSKQTGRAQPRNPAGKLSPDKLAPCGQGVDMLDAMTIVAGARRGARDSRSLSFGEATCADRSGN
ncbi:hypothetical protein HDK64DRAFT_141686 [Phyllosticta capitalensis]